MIIVSPFVCNTGNFDPLGIHASNSIIVAFSQTFSEEDYNMFRSIAASVIRHFSVI